MKTRSKIGGRKGSPAFRTPSGFIYRQSLKISPFKGGKKQGMINYDKKDK